MWISPGRGCNYWRLQTACRDSLATLSAILGYSDLQQFDLVEEQAPVTAAASGRCSPLIAEGLQQRPEVSALQHDLTASQKFSHAEHDLSRPTVSALGAVGLAPVRAPSTHELVRSGGRECQHSHL